MKNIVKNLVVWDIVFGAWKCKRLKIDVFHRCVQFLAFALSCIPKYKNCHTFLVFVGAPVLSRELCLIHQVTVDINSTYACSNVKFLWSEDMKWEDKSFNHIKFKTSAGKQNKCQEKSIKSVQNYWGLIWGTLNGGRCVLTLYSVHSVCGHIPNVKRFG